MRTCLLYTSDLEQLLSIEEILEASRIPMEQREAARKMGSRFAKTIEKLELPVTKEENGIFRRYLTARKGQAINHCCISVSYTHLDVYKRQIDNF